MKPIFRFSLTLLLSFTCASLYAETERVILGKSGNLKVPKASGLPLGDIKAFQVKGTVTWKNPEGKDMGRLKRGQVIHEKSWVITDKKASALLMFSNGSTINLGQETRMEVQVYAQEPYDRKKGMYLTLKEDPSLSKCHMYLHAGELIGTVQKLRQDSTYQIEAPLGTAGIRGTTYYVGFGINKATGNYLMQVSNFEGKVLVDTPLEAELVMSDESVANGQYNPYSGPKVYDVPEKTLVLIEADQELLDLGYLPTLSPVSSFADFFKQGSIQQLLKELNASSNVNQSIEDRPDTSDGDHVDPEIAQTPE